MATSTFSTAERRFRCAAHRGRTAENSGRSSMLSSADRGADRLFSSARQDFPRARDDRLRKACELGDLDTIRAVGGARLNLMQKNDRNPATR